MKPELKKDHRLNDSEKYLKILKIKNCRGVIADRKRSKECVVEAANACKGCRACEEKQVIN